ncbi:MAG TPA: MFS transporter [Candidatus Angelobacter sp.]|nr:MFS transporter [Candidatus Angelobacter sp.]
MSRLGDAVGETRRSLATVFRNPGLRRVNLAFAGSAIGDWAYATAIAVWAYGVGGVTAVGVFGTVRLALMAIASPFTSTLADRYSRKMIMIGCDVTRGSLIAVNSFLIWKEASPGVIFTIAGLTAVVATPFRPAVAALLPSLVDSPEELTASNGTTSTIESLAIFVGPAIGGLLLTVASIPVVGLFDVLTFVWSALLVSRIVISHGDKVAVMVPDTTGSSGSSDEPATEPAAEKETFFQEVTAGFRSIAASRDLTMISLVYCAQTVVAGASAVFSIEIAVRMTSFGANGVGYLDSAFGVGAILGGFVAIGRATARKLATDFGVGVVFWALPLLLVAVVPQAAPAFLAMAVIGFANPIVDVNASTILQRLTPDAVLGRVFGALDTGLIAGMALGSMLMPLLIHLTGLRWSLAILGVGISVVVLPAFPRFRRLDVALGEPEGLPLLRRVALFSPLEPQRLEAIAQQLGRREVAAGEVVIREGDSGDRFYIVESGRTTATHDGRVLSSQGPGDPFGEIALLRDVPRTATVTADEPSVLLYLERDAFLAAVAGDDEVSTRADDLVSRRIPTY